MKIGTSGRLALVVGLGVLAGFGFIALPGLAINSTPPAAFTTKTGTNSNTTAATGSTNMLLVNSTRTQQKPAENGVTLVGLSVLVALLVVPALTVSVLTLTFATRRARRSLNRAS